MHTNCWFEALKKHPPPTPIAIKNQLNLSWKGDYMKQLYVRRDLGRIEKMLTLLKKKRTQHELKQININRENFFFTKVEFIVANDKWVVLLGSATRL